MQIATPWALLLILAIPALIILVRRFGKTGSLRVSAVNDLAASGSSLKLRLLKIPFILRLLVLALLALALARPREGMERIVDKNNGIAIEMVLDRSGSMSEEMAYHGQRATRLDVAKQVFKDFVMGGGSLKGRPNDLVGMITFARYSDTICPLTLGHEALPQFLKQIQLVKQRNEDGTAIGDALELAAARLHVAETELKKRSLLKDNDYTIKSKIIILLTDGQDNASRTSIAEAAAMCKEWGIKVYAIGIGGGEGQGFINTPLGRIPFGGGTGVDVPRLKYLAKETGGRFYLAESEEGLKEIYENIDKLEKSEIESTRYVDYSEKFMPLAIAALALLALEILLRSTYLRTLP